MKNARKVVAASGALYIKLGRKGSWEKECLQNGILRFGYKETPFDAAVSGDWETVWKAWYKRRGDSGTATRDLGQIRNFFEAPRNILWITFSDGMLWWCFAKPGVKIHKDKKGTFRECLEGWKNTDINQKVLSREKLSGSLLKVQGFRGTICDVKAIDYLVRKLNAELLPDVELAIKAENQMVACIRRLIALLRPKDFELLIDLIFSTSGWRRIGETGKTQKDIDMELVLPTTGERACVQVKSSADKRTLEDYLARFESSSLYDRMIFVWHTGKLPELPENRQNVVLIGPDQLSRMVFDAGLTSWLREKVS